MHKYSWWWCSRLEAGLPHLLIVVLPRYEVIHQSDPVAQLLAQSVQELVCVPAARRAGEGEQFLAAGQRVGGAIRVLRGGGGAFQADIRVGVHTALVVDLIHRRGERLLPGQGQARFTVTCEEGNQRWLPELVFDTLQMFRSRISDWMTWLIHYATYSLKKLCVTFLVMLSP